MACWCSCERNTEEADDPRRPPWNAIAGPWRVAEGRFDFIEGDREIIPGLSSLRTPGHTPHHQSILIDGGHGIACFLGDICPTSAHLPLPWIMGYDVEPLVSLETKRWLLRRAAAERWLLIYEHDATTAWTRVRHDGKAYVTDPD